MTHKTIADVEHTEKMMREARLAERERCARIAEAIDSGRGNEKEIARAIRNQHIEVK